MEYINRKTVYATQEKKEIKQKAETQKEMKAKSEMVDLAFNISIIT